MTRSFLGNLGILDTDDPWQIEFFMAQAMPEHEQERLAKIYENRKDETVSSYELWTAVISEQTLLRNSLMCQAMHNRIFDNATVEIRTKVINSKTYNPNDKTNLDAILTGLSTSNLIRIWKDFQFIRTI